MGFQNIAQAKNDNHIYILDSYLAWTQIAIYKIEINLVDAKQV